MLFLRPLLGSFVLASFSALAMGCAVGDPGTRSIYVVPSSLDELHDESFFDHPWPSDLRLEDGAPRLAGYYNPRQLPIIAEYVDSTKGELDGFSPASAGYLRFTGAIDESSLPENPLDALNPDASVQLIDIDPSSAERGQRRLVSLRWNGPEGVYYRENTLAFMPVIGFPLRPHTRYALVVTRALLGADGVPVEASDDLKAVLGENPPDGRTQAAHDALADAIAEIETAGVSRDEIAHLAVYTTADPTAETFAVRDHLVKNVPVPSAHADAWQLFESTTTYDEYVGVYGPSPNYQAGLVPFEQYGDGGEFVFENGVPKVFDSFDLRFSLMVPKADRCPVPDAGYPIALYAHGTGGDYRSYVNDGSGESLAEQCIATMGVDQIFHGTRPGAPTDGNEAKIELLFFNFQNPMAARTNTRQSAIDEVQRARLFTQGKMTVPTMVSATGKEIHFDASKLTFFGHSQGGLNGPLFLAADDAARGGVLSGSGALISIALLEKTQPEPSVASLVKTIFLAVKGEEEAEVDAFHPIISLAQSIVDVSDPIHYARYIVREPREGQHSKSIYMTEGIDAAGVGDNFAPPHGIEAHALAMGLPLQLPAQRMLEAPVVDNLWPTTIPASGLSGNIGQGNASGVLAQWAPPPNKDGHFVVFVVPGARMQAAEFMLNLTAETKGRVPAP